MTIRAITNGATVVTAMGLGLALFGSPKLAGPGLLAACVAWLPILFAYCFGESASVASEKEHLQQRLRETQERLERLAK